jgi:hypothetical protein
VTRRRAYLITLASLFVLLMGLFLSGKLDSIQPTQAALVVGDEDSEVLIGPDDDNVDNPVIQPEDADVDQSLNNTDILLGDKGNDVAIGLLGNDVISGGPGWDITIGGTEQFETPNSDVIFGDSDDDVNIWAPGDGSDAYTGGAGTDAQVFGVIDRDDENVPTLSDPVSGFPEGVPTADVSGQGGFCTLERVEEDTDLGYEFLVRFFVRATGDLAVTIRLAETEQVFCTSEEGGQITFADLTEDDPEFKEVELEEVKDLNKVVAQIIR